MRELKSKNTWLVWKYEIADGKKKKIPMKPYGFGRCGTDTKKARNCIPCASLNLKIWPEMLELIITVRKNLKVRTGGSKGAGGINQETM